MVAGATTASDDPVDRVAAGDLSGGSKVYFVEPASNHPHLNLPGGCEVEVHKAQPIPGM